MKNVSLAVILILVCALSLQAIDSDPDGYGSITDFLNGIYGVDNNSGLTAFHVLNIQMGGRSEGMAGAFSAVSDDISFIEWNPAGSSRLDNSEIAFFHNNWIADTKLEAAAYNGRIKDFGFGVLGKLLYTPITQYGIFGDRLSKGYYSEAVAVLNASYNLFNGFYFGGLSVGMNIKGAFRIVPDYADGDGIIASDSGKSQSAATVMGDFGLLTRINFLKFYNARDKNMSFALVLKNLGMPAMDDPLPTVAVAGFSYRPFRPILVSFDFSYPINILNIELSEKPYFAVGLSVAVAKFLSMRGGVLIKAGNMRAAIGSAINLGSLSFDINYTLDLVTQLQPLNRVTVGVRLSLGDGQRKKNSDLVDEYYLAGLEAYMRGDDAEASKLFKEALAINPRFDPAKEGIAAIDNFSSLLKRIDDMQKLDY